MYNNYWFGKKRKNVPRGSNNEDAVWLESTFVCTVEYMPNYKGSLKQPVLKGTREELFILQNRIEQFFKFLIQCNSQNKCYSAK